MTVSPADAEHLAADVRAHYVALESSLLALLVRQIKRHINAPDWPVRQQAERWRFERLLMAQLALSEREAKALVEEAVTEAYALGRGEVPGAVNAAAGILRGAALAVTAWQTIRATYPALRQAVMRAYQDAIFAGGIDPSTRKQAVQPLLNALAGRGLSVPTQTLTARWGIAEYTEMSTRAATGRAVAKGAVDAMAATGEDLVQISAHGGACPICRPWEGAILSISGRSTEYRTLDAAMADGLFHVNCRHQAFQYERGMKIPFWEPERDRAGSYEAAQKQRYIERNIRHWKRKELVALTDADRLKASAKVRQWQAAAREHVSATGTFRKYERERVAGQLRDRDRGPIAMPKGNVPRPPQPKAPTPAPSPSPASREFATERSRLVHEWVHGSNRKTSVMMKQALRDEFGTRGLVVNRNKWNVEAKTVEAMRPTVRRMYEETQTDFKAKGITHVTLYRGIKSGQPVEGVVASWTSDTTTATKFNGYTIKQEVVPVERIFMYHQGPGWKNGKYGQQYEYMVMPEAPK